MPRFGVKQFAIVVFLCFVWGANLIALKIGFAGVSPVCSASLRFALGLAGLLAWAAASRIRIAPPAGSIPALVFSSVQSSLVFTLFAVGIDRTTVQRGAIMLYTQPVFVSLIEHFTTKNEKLNAAKGAGLLLSFAGVVVVFSDGIGGASAKYLTGDALVLGASAVWAAHTLYQKNLNRRIDPTLVILYLFLFGAPMLLGVAALLGERMVFDLNAKVAAALLFQGLFVAAFTFVVWNRLLKTYPAGKLSSFLFLTPIFGVLLAGLFQGEGFTLKILAGLALTSAGVYVVSSRGSRSEDESVLKL